MLSPWATEEEATGNKDLGSCIWLHSKSPQAYSFFLDSSFLEGPWVGVICWAVVFFQLLLFEGQLGTLFKFSQRISLRFYKPVN